VVAVSREGVAAGDTDMADKEYETEPYIKGYRQELAKMDEVAQMVLKGHLEIESNIDFALGAIFKRKVWLKKTKLKFVDKAKLVRAFIENDKENFGWPLIFGFNALRNEIAHGEDNEGRRAKIRELRNLLQGYGDAKFDQFIKTTSEADVIAHAAALSRGFLLSVESDIRAQGH
jgi:hypothetical protein